MDKTKPLNFILIGRAGSGKGTQAKLLMNHFKNLSSISTGDLFRNLAKADTAVGEKIREILDKGGLPYDDLATMLWMYEISYNIKTDQGIIADGFPRRVNEAKDLDRFLDFLGRKENTFNILIDISRQEALDRLTKRRICKECKRLVPWVGEFKKLKVCDKCEGELMVRHDDNPDAINNRLDYYESRVVEAIEYYKSQKRLITINGEQGIEDVSKDILKALK